MTTAKLLLPMPTILFFVTSSAAAADYFWHRSNSGAGTTAGACSDIHGDGEDDYDCSTGGVVSATTSVAITGGSYNGEVEGQGAFNPNDQAVWNFEGTILDSSNWGLDENQYFESSLACENTWVGDFELTSPDATSASLTYDLSMTWGATGSTGNLFYMRDISIKFGSVTVYKNDNGFPVFEYPGDFSYPMQVVGTTSLDAVSGSFAVIKTFDDVAVPQTFHLRAHDDKTGNTPARQKSDLRSAGGEGDGLHSGTYAVNWFEVTAGPPQ